MSVEIYVSTDVEADGPIPGPHSMLSFASAAYTADKQLIGTFSANLETLPGAAAHPIQEAWWKTQPEAWAACRLDLQQPEVALPAYVEWVEKLPGKAVFVAYPAGFDFTYMFWYMMRFAQRCPFSWSALDIKTLAFAMTGLPYRKSIKPRLPSAWFDEHPHTHVALDDAIEQGALFCNMLAELRRREARYAELDALHPPASAETSAPDKTGQQADEDAS
ncbi:exonuclease [Pararobbsia silviterrae]|uniref:Exonuclease n=1 Tax=Pararobbsia silviterrae TaxID=1792498 RepID=A0A494X4K8_9BURK|nr:exonuclease [Pararobbsia silviterrae]RKP45310.1 exonuclease [Pararobbsia silviterrae]